VLLIIDQAYGEFDTQDHSPVFKLLQQQNTVITRTFSKAYCLAGQRLGWGAFPELIAGEVRKLLNPNNVSVVGQAMGIAAMLDQNYLKKVVQQTADIRDTFQQTLQAGSMPTPISYTNFVLLPFKDNQTAINADTALKRAGFIARGMGGYNLSHCLRVTIGTPDVMQTVADELLQLNVEL
jgi:histidinol-phosphate/aromatic aminotransferase/cobyric acid decarboxylase-like protein